MIHKIEALLARQPRVFVCIDGMCCSGKTTLATRIALIFSGNLVHMDDFYLPRPAHTDEPGGNIDVRRLKNEVLEPLRRGECAQYSAFSCAGQTLSRAVTVEPRALTVVEGSYSMLPQLRGFYDLTAFMRVSDEKQRTRVLAREGEYAQQYFDEWIPREHKYFEQTDIARSCDIIIDA